MPDDFDFEDRLNTLEDVLRRLAGMMAEQHTINQRFDGYMQEQREINRAQVRINADVSATLARLETLMKEVFRQRHNGRDA